MDPLIHCSRCKMTVQTECKEEDHTTCSLFKSAEARKAHNKAVMTTNWPLGKSADESGGRKDDDGKVPFDLLAPEFLSGTAIVLQFGAKKYKAYNWSKGMKWSRVFAALMRHLWKWWGGEKLDPETGLSHLWHASCGLMFLIAYEERGTGDDDRPTDDA